MKGYWCVNDVFCYHWLRQRYPSFRCFITLHDLSCAAVRQHFEIVEDADPV